MGPSGFPSTQLVPLLGILLLGSLWVGCGDGGPAGIDSDPPGEGPPGSDSLPANDTVPAESGRVMGTVDRTEIGGTGLTVFSVTDSFAAVQADSFSAMVSDSTAQLIMAVDAAESVRGLALTVPDSAGVPQGGAEGGFRIDAESTALGLLFLTPGALVAGPEVAEERATELRSYPSFAGLVDYRRGILPVTPLDSLARRNVKRRAWITYTHDTSYGVKLFPQGVRGSNIHKPFLFDAFEEPDGTINCTVESEEYGYVDLQTGVLLNTPDFTGPSDGGSDELGMPADCFGPGLDQLFKGFLVVPFYEGEQGGG